MNINFARALGAALLVLSGTSAWALDATPNPEWSVIRLTADIAKPAATAWKKIGGNDWCGIGKYLAIQSCSIVKGDGGVGSVRLIKNNNMDIIELAVARTPLSYTYAQPLSPIFYHGTMAVEPIDSTHSRLVYTLIYDEAPLKTDKAKAENREQRRARFQAAVDKMKAAAQTP